MTPTRIKLSAALLVGALLSGTLSQCDVPGVPPIPQRTYPGAWIVCVEESGERTPSVAAFVDDTQYHADLASRQLNWRIYDDDSPDAQRYRSQVNTLPALVILDADGKQLHVGPWPDDLDKVVQEVTGL